MLVQSILSIGHSLYLYYELLISGHFLQIQSHNFNQQLYIYMLSVCVYFLDLKDVIVEINQHKNIRKHHIQKEQDHVAGQEIKLLQMEDQEVEKENQEHITVAIVQILPHQYPNQDHLKEKAHQESIKSTNTKVDLLQSPDVNQNHLKENCHQESIKVTNTQVNLLRSPDVNQDHLKENGHQESIKVTNIEVCRSASKSRRK